MGLLWALVVFGCEAGFTLLAVPVLASHGPAGVSVHTTWLAAAIFGALALGTEGWRAAGDFDTGEILAIGYLAVGVTAVAFILWYTCVRRLGAGPAGLLTGVAPVAAAVIGIPVTGALPAAAVWVGVGLIACGLALGLRDSGITGQAPASERMPDISRFSPKSNRASKSSSCSTGLDARCG